MHSQYSSSVSPFQAKTGTPVGRRGGAARGPTTTAAAAWSWVEKMLQEAQRTSAPRSTQRLDEHRGLDGHVERAGDALALQRLLLARTRCRTDMRPGISFSASSISLRPQSASERSFTRYSNARGDAELAGGLGHRSCFLPSCRCGMSGNGVSGRRARASSSAGPLAAGSGGSGRQVASAKPAAREQLGERGRARSRARPGRRGGGSPRRRGARRPPARRGRPGAARGPPRRARGPGRPPSRATSTSSAASQEASSRGSASRVAAPQLHVAEPGGAAAGRAEHGGRLVHADHAGHVGRERRGERAGAAAQVGHGPVRAAGARASAATPKPVPYHSARSRSQSPAAPAKNASAPLAPLRAAAGSSRSWSCCERGPAARSRRGPPSRAGGPPGRPRPDIR